MVFVYIYYVCVRACMHACVRACVHACMRACVRACVRACMCVCVCVCVVYTNTIPARIVWAHSHLLLTLLHRGNQVTIETESE